MNKCQPSLIELFSSEEDNLHFGKIYIGKIYIGKIYIERPGQGLQHKMVCGELGGCMEFRKGKMWTLYHGKGRNSLTKECFWWN